MVRRYGETKKFGLTLKTKFVKSVVIFYSGGFYNSYLEGHYEFCGCYVNERRSNRATIRLVLYSVNWQSSSLLNGLSELSLILKSNKEPSDFIDLNIDITKKTMAKPHKNENIE